MSDYKQVDDSVAKFKHVAKLQSNSTETFSSYNDPTLLRFALIPNFNLHHGLLASEDNVNSALAYLKRIGEEDRFSALKKFIELFNNILVRAPWQLISVTGLDTFINNQINKPVFEEDATLTFNFIETVDWRMQTLISLWKYVTFDKERYVEVLPKNLQEFNFSIYVTDVRKLATDKVGGDNGSNWKILVNDISREQLGLSEYQHRLFSFAKAVMTLNSGTAGYDEISNAEPSVLEGMNIEIKPRIFMESGRFPAIVGDLIIANDSTDVKTGVFGKGYETGIEAKIGRIKDKAADLMDLEKQSARLKNIMYDAKDSAIGMASQIAVSTIDSFNLINVYDFDIKTALGLINNGNPNEVLKQAISLSETQQLLNKGTKIFEEPEEHISEINKKLFG